MKFDAPRTDATPTGWREKIEKSTDAPSRAN